MNGTHLTGMQSKIIVCPECKKRACNHSSRRSEGFDDNFFINCLVDEFILKCKVEGEAEIKCDEFSGEDTVVAFCPDCTMFLSCL